VLNNPGLSSLEDVPPDVRSLVAASVAQARAAAAADTGDGAAAAALADVELPVLVCAPLLDGCGDPVDVAATGCDGGSDGGGGELTAPAAPPLASIDDGETSEVRFQLSNS